MISSATPSHQAAISVITTTPAAKKPKKINWSNFLVGTCLSFATQPFEVLRTSSIINKSNFTGTTFTDLFA